MVLNEPLEENEKDSQLTFCRTSSTVCARLSFKPSIALYLDLLAKIVPTSFHVFTLGDSGRFVPCDEDGIGSPNARGGGVGGEFTNSAYMLGASRCSSLESDIGSPSIAKGLEESLSITSFEMSMVMPPHQYLPDPDSESEGGGD